MQANLKPKLGELRELGKLGEREYFCKNRMLPIFRTVENRTELPQIKAIQVQVEQKEVLR
ncbi:MAG: hypothetical protein F6J92_39625 [Symploca sp. SIO1A3]|nr:hypothetical protein [Symploca sp. SIO1A3]